MENDQNMTIFLDQINDRIIVYDGIIGLITVLVSIFVAILLFWQIKKQSKRESARLLWEFVRRLQEDDFRLANKSIVDKTKTRHDQLELKRDYFNGTEEIKYGVLIPRFLNHFSRMAVLNEMGVVELKHIESMFRGYLVNIKDSTEVSLLIDDRQKLHPDDFKPLQRLLDKLD